MAKTLEMPASPPAQRVVVIGLDGATLDLVGPWMLAGILPNLAQLKDHGGAGRLRSVLPVLSPAAWSSFATGVNPGRHGVFDFAQRIPGSYVHRLVTARDIHAPTIWRLLSDEGKRVALLNVPMTWPPESINGVMVTGLGTPDNQVFTYPPEFGQQLLARGYKVNKTVFYRPGREEAFLQDVYAITQRLTNAAVDLLKQEPWDLFMVVFRDSDEMSHFFWKHMDSHHPDHGSLKDAAYRNALQEYFQYLDTCIGQLVHTAGPDVDIIVMSDHGLGPLYKDVFLNEWLHQRGWLVPEPRPQISVQDWLAGLGVTRSNISRTLQAAGLASLERKLRALLGEKAKVLPRDRRRVFPDGINWERTRAYSVGYHGQVFLNVRGREPRGIVEPGPEYTRLRNEIAEELRRIVDPEDGKPVVSELYLNEDVFSGKYAEAAADLTIIMRDLAYITRQGYEFASQSGQVFGHPSTFESGSHRLNGLLIAAGPNFQKYEQLPDYSILDLAPTILNLLGFEAPEYMEGRTLPNADVPPLHRLFAECSLYNPESLKPGFTEEEEKEVLERLHKLGYLD